ncbi:MAG: hypothetical protein V7K15_24885 [Nostoc sp.]
MVHGLTKSVPGHEVSVNNPNTIYGDRKSLPWHEHPFSRVLIDSGKLSA